MDEFMNGWTDDGCTGTLTGTQVKGQTNKWMNGRILV